MESVERVKHIINDYFQYFFMIFMIVVVAIMIIIIVIVNTQAPKPTSRTHLAIPNVAAVRGSKDSVRNFANFDQLNDESVVVAVTQGLGSVVRQALPHAQVKEVSTAETLLTVTKEGFAHVAFASPEAIEGLTEKCGKQCTRFNLQ